MARSRGTGLKCIRKAWPLLFRASSYPLGAQSESDLGGGTRTRLFQRGEGGHQIPPCYHNRCS